MEKPEMSLEKLQKISASIVQPKYKVKWLDMWNSSEINRAALKFPPPGITDEKLDTWLHKAVFWAEVIYFSKPMSIIFNQFYFLYYNTKYDEIKMIIQNLTMHYYSWILLPLMKSTVLLLRRSCQLIGTQMTWTRLKII
jgi:hypothetical protein